MQKLIKLVRKNPLEAVVFLVILGFSTLLMLKTFRLEAGELKIAAKAWSDFAATIPLIRSFSLGDNLPPQYPIFAGPPIRYHFVFFLLVGLLEKMGLTIDWALNSLSVVSFLALALAIYYLARVAFKKRLVAYLSLVLFLFNGSFSFLEFFKNHPLSLNSLKEIVTNSQFSSFGPYDGKVVSAFWNLNIYTNQRHLALAYAAFLILVLIIYKADRNPKWLSLRRTFILGVGIGLFPFWHSAVFGMLGIGLVVFFLIYPKLRTKILIMGLLALALAVPQVLYMGKSQVSVWYFSPGYLVEPLTLKSFLSYWFLNLGIGIFVALVGIFLADKNQRKIFLPFLALFIVGNLFRFTPEIAANHKFFNLFLIGMNLFSAFALCLLWKKGVFGKIVFIVALLLLTLSGLIDLFPILNDSYVRIPDYQKNATSLFILKHTPGSATFLNSSLLYDPASLAGRKIYLGWPYFSWSAGYDTDSRFRTLKTILEGKDKQATCSLLTAEGIDYIEIQKPTVIEDVLPNYQLFSKEFSLIYSLPEAGLSIYDVEASCKGEGAN
jgi:hypothetical protein